MAPRGKFALNWMVMLPSVLRVHGRPDRQDLHRSAAGRARGDAARHVARRSRVRAPRRRWRSSARTSTRPPRCEGAICQDTGMPTFEVKTPVGVNQIVLEEADQGGGGRGHQARQAPAQLRGLAHRREQRQQPRAGHADHPLRAVGARRHRGEADPQGRRLREHERAVLGARPNCRTWAAPIARSKACASASCTRCGRRRARAARPAPSACASAAIARAATSRPSSSCSARSTT